MMRSPQITNQIVDLIEQLITLREDMKRDKDKYAKHVAKAVGDLKRIILESTGL